MPKINKKDVALDEKCPDYEILDSISELKIRVFGATLKDLFLHALKAMFECIGPNYELGVDRVTHPFALTAPDKESLLIDFLSEALFYSDTNNEAFFEAAFNELKENSAQGLFIGKKITAIAIEIKAITYHDVHIVQNNDRLCTELLFDI
jgi:SHS2 domain-containing protein